MNNKNILFKIASIFCVMSVFWIQVSTVYAALSAGSMGADCTPDEGCIPGLYCNPSSLRCMTDNRPKGGNVSSIENKIAAEGAECNLAGVTCAEGLVCMGSLNSTIFKCLASTKAQVAGDTHGYNPPIRMSTDSGAETFVQQTIGKIISGILPIVGALFLVMFIYGGFLYLTAGGDSAKVDLAHKTFLNAFIGMAMIFCANFIITYFISAFDR